MIINEPFPKMLIFLSVLATEVDKLFVSVFAVFPLLHELYLNNNNIHTVSPSSFHLPSLTTLDISHNSLSDVSDYFFDSSPQLRSINLSHNSVSSLIGSRIQKFSWNSIPIQCWVFETFLNICPSRLDVQQHFNIYF